MPHLGLVGQGEEVGVNLVLAQGGQGEGGHELGARLGQDRTHGDPLSAQQADKLQTLIGRNSAAHDQ